MLKFKIETRRPGRLALGPQHQEPMKLRGGKLNVTKICLISTFLTADFRQKRTVFFER